LVKLPIWVREIGKGFLELQRVVDIKITFFAENVDLEKSEKFGIYLTVIV
jgi:hypothetical protein